MRRSNLQTVFNPFSTPRRRAGIVTAAVCLGILALNFLLQIWTNTSYQGMSVDSGVFAYCGQRILDGDLLYRDCYDNKPPLVYYLNALAIVLTGGNPGGIWLFQAAWMGMTAVACYLVFRRIWGGDPALVSSLLFVFSVLFPGYYQNGNYTETYTLVANILLLGALYRALTTRKRRFYAAIGLLTAFAFLLKPTYVALGGCASLVVLYAELRRGPLRWHELRQAAVNGLWILAWAAPPLLLTALYWYARGGLSDYWFAVFVHNRQYVAVGAGGWMVKETLLKFLYSQPLAYLFGMALVSGGLLLIERWRLLLPFWPTVAPSDDSDTARAWVTLAALLSIPLEIYLVALSAKDFGHYYLVPIAALAALSAPLFHTVGQGLKPPRAAAAIVAGLALAAMSIPWANNVRIAETPQPGAWSSYWKNPGITSYTFSDLEQYIVDHSQPDQSVLVWATHPSLNLLTGRRSPTRYVYLLHVLEQTPTGASGFPELIDELKADPPALIVAQKASSVGLPDFWSDDASLCTSCTDAARQGLLAFKAYVNEHYEFSVQIYDWYVYKKKG